VSLLVIGLGLVGVVLLALWPAFTRSVSELPLKQPGRALLVGVAVLFGGPVALFLLFVSVIGVPLGVLGLFVYLLLFPLGYVAAALAISDGLLSRWRPDERRVSFRALMLVLVLLVLSLVVALPIVGPPLGFAATALGAGSLTLSVARRVRPRGGERARRPSAAAGPASSGRLASPASG
jgi:hypothetical protein